MKSKNITTYLLLLSVTAHCSVSAQMWFGPVMAVNPNIGTGAISGEYTQMLVVNGHPAIADYSRYHLQYRRALDPTGINWDTATTVDPARFTGKHLSIEIINGNPAISYYDETNGDLKYVRSLDPSGTKWGTPIVVASAGNVGLYTSLKVVNRQPAISYYDLTDGDLKYVRSLDEDGIDWGTPISLDVNGRTGLHTSMQLINGLPAISYYDSTQGHLKINSSNDPSGVSGTWGSPISLDSGNCGLYSSLQEVNGEAAIAYYQYFYTFFGRTVGYLKYISIVNIAGSKAWTIPQFLDGDGSSDVGSHCSLQIVDGIPAVSYLDNYSRRLKYIRASDAAGRWGTSPKYIFADVSILGGFYTSLQVVDGKPAIAYHDQTHFDLKYVHANDPAGDAWGNPLTFDAVGQSGEYVSLQIVNGRPAMAYSDGGARDYRSSNHDLVFVRSNNTAGTSWGPRKTVGDDGGTHVSLLVVQGKPAISYVDGDGHVKYVRAIDPDGINWGVPVMVDASSTMGGYTSLQIADGYPAIAYYVANYSTVSTGAIEGHVKYARANQLEGASWDPPVNVAGQFNSAATFTYKDVSLREINGKPAIAFFGTGPPAPAPDLQYLYYVRANDPSGIDWAGGIATILDQGEIGGGTSLQEVNHRPAVSYTVNFYTIPGSNSQLKYKRATDPIGAQWDPVGSFVPVDVAANIVSPTSMQIIDGFPAIAYYDHDRITLVGRQKYVRADDVNGSGWGTPETIAVTPIGGYISYTSMVSTTDCAAVGYYDAYDELPYFVFCGSHYNLVNTTTTITQNITGNSAININDGFDKLVTLTPTGGANALRRDVTTTVTISPTVPVNNNKPYVQRYYDIVPSVNPNNAEALVTLYFTEQEFKNFNDYVTTNHLGIDLLPTPPNDNGKVRITQIHGRFTSTSDPSSLITPSVVWDNSHNWWTVSFPVSGFSRFYLSTVNLTPLPLTLLEFEGRLQQNTVVLQWLTTNEVNTKEFIIERQDNRNAVFSALGNVAAVFGTGTHQYSFTDARPVKGDNLYRLKIMDRDGNFSYSKTVSIKINNALRKLFVYPNPVTSNMINLQFINQPEGMYVVRLLNQSGQSLVEKLVSHNNRSSTETIELKSSIPKGYYVLEVTAPDKIKNSFNIFY